MITRLKPKQEHFCKRIRDGLSGIAAYTEAYTRPGYTPAPAIAGIGATKLLKLASVQARIAELHSQREAVAHITMEKLTAELLATAAEARFLEQLGAATSAYGLIAKMHGFLIDKQQIDLTVISKPMASPTHEIDLSPEEWSRRWQTPLLEPPLPFVRSTGTDPLKNGGSNGHS